MYDFGSLYLLPSVAGSNLSDDDYAKLLSTSISEYHLESFYWLMFAFIFYFLAS